MADEEPESEEGRVFIRVGVDPDLRHRAKIAAAKEKTTLSEVIRQALEDFASGRKSGKSDKTRR